MLLRWLAEAEALEQLDRAPRSQLAVYNYVRRPDDWSISAGSAPIASAEPPPEIHALTSQISCLCSENFVCEICSRTDTPACVYRHSTHEIYGFSLFLYVNASRATADAVIE